MFSKYRHAIGLCALGLLFLASRLYTASTAGSFWFDEAFSWHVASLPWHEARELLRYEHNPWLHFTLLRGVAAFADTEFFLRLPSVMAGFASMLALYAAGARLFENKKTGLLAAFLLTISTLHLYHQTEARMYAFVTLFAATSLLSAWNWLQATAQRYRHAWLFAYAVSTLALVHTHMTAWLFVAVLWAAIGFEARHMKRQTLGWHAANALPFITGLIWFWPVAAYRLGQSSTAQGWFFDQHQSGYLMTHLTNVLMNGESRLLLRFAGALMLIFAFGLAFLTVEKPTWWQKITHVFDRDHWPLSLRMEWSQPLRLLLFLFGGMMLGGLALQITVTKYLLAASVPLFLIMAHGLSRLQKSLTLVLLAFIVLVAPMHAQLWQKRHHWDEAAQRAAQLQAEHEDSVTIVHSFAYALPLRQYLRNNEVVMPFFPLDDAMPFGQAVARYNWQPIVSEENVSRLDAIVAAHDMVILVSSTGEQAANDPVKARLWQLGYKLLEQEQYPGYGDPAILVFGR